MQNLPAKIVKFEMLQNATELETLDAFNTSLGPLKFDTFSNMESLNYLNLSKTELSHIDYGMFTHQKYIVTLDLSYNKLEFFDINIFSRMIYLETLYIHGNSLTEIEHIENIKSIISRLYVIKIHENHWNCTYLAKILKILDQRYIFVEHPENPVKNSPNVLGIGCKTKLQSKIQPISGDQGNETISKKLNEIIDQINEEKTKRENHKFDADVMKSEIHNIQKEILDIKSTILTIQKDENQRQANSSNEFNAFKELIEHFKNITLEKEKKAHELATQNKGLNAFEFLLTIFITFFAVSSAFYAYNRLKKHLFVRINMIDGQRAQSTNTVNSTVELPISEMRF
ncbi:hypothetical protein PVAND_000685 [Polypedilum vanderplanki]|uniref:Uncharacterized protein n=1 Tax=Polypedilum vanderplanki TaxID=319348 RepID=A0A9J6BLS2_POLVA|nr:hypothetical protein PVAND_000685 [Polypedilum vanderplanki]